MVHTIGGVGGCDGDGPAGAVATFGSTAAFNCCRVDGMSRCTAAGDGRWVLLQGASWILRSVQWVPRDGVHAAVLATMHCAAPLNCPATGARVHRTFNGTAFSALAEEEALRVCVWWWWWWWWGGGSHCAVLPMSAFQCDAVGPFALCTCDMPFCGVRLSPY